MLFPFRLSREIGDFRSLVIVLPLGVFFGAVLAADGATIHYGDLAGANVRYVGISESSGTDGGSLYGKPTVSLDTLSFSPVGFGAFSGGGGVPDITDGQVNVDIRAMTEAGGLHTTVIDRIQFAGAGDFTLTGFSGSGATYVDVSANFTVTIREVDCIAINPIPAQFTMSYLQQRDGLVQLGLDGAGPVMSENWMGSLDIDIVQMLNNEALSYQYGVTMVSVALDSVHVAGSESGTSAFIANKALNVLPITSTHPEPGSLLLIAFGGGVALLRRHRGVSPS